MLRIPKCMSTQHPDNVNSPFFAENTELDSEDEIQEAYYVFSHLGCDEQMWDCEGKEVDNFVIRKLLSKYETYFKEKKLGQDVNITLRVPNPNIEKTEAKILLETLESIPRSYDAAKLFYNSNTPPIFEVVLPMVSDAKSLDRIYRYYSDFIIKRQEKPLKKNDITIADWIGKFNPKNINIIPLFEDMKSMLSADKITREYLEDKDIDYQRVFLARSDPAMNYGLVSATLLNKIALQNLYNLSQKIGVKIYPIVGVGGAPFRGNLRPQNVDNVLNEYRSVHTFTIQSSFKYDNEPNEVERAIEKLKIHQTEKPREIDEVKSKELINRYVKAFQKQVIELAPVINQVAKYIPSRRKRKLHIGLFGYARQTKKINLPRAISFTAALYSIGLPPELLGLNALTQADFKFLKNNYINFEQDLGDALQYFNPNTPYLPKDLKMSLQNLGVNYKINKEHKNITDHVLEELKRCNGNNLGENILSAAHIRKFLG